MPGSDAVVQVTESRYAELLAAEAERDRMAPQVDQLGRDIARERARQDQLAAEIESLRRLVAAGHHGDDDDGGGA